MAPSRVPPGREPVLNDVERVINFDGSVAPLVNADKINSDQVVLRTLNYRSVFCYLC